MEEAFILSLDQGTTSSRSLLIDRNGLIRADAQKEFRQIFPKPGWVEHDPLEIWDSQLETIKKLFSKASVSVEQIAAVGITNQRETTLVWDRKTGDPICNAIVWQDRRTAAYCDELVRDGKSETIQAKTGLVLDAYFSATKLKWILDHNPGSRKRAEKGELCFGTVDSWLIYKLSKGRSHITDVSNASRTMLFNINTLSWDSELLELFDVPEAMLPEVCENSGSLSRVDASLFGKEIPVSGIAGDQQAALFGQMCVEPGMAKNTYGTGCFLLMNTGHTPVKSANKLLTTVAWTLNGVTNYALEGSVFVGGAAVQWIRDGLNLIEKAAEIESLALSVEDNGGVIFVPALTGLGAPHWDPYARGAILGLTRGTHKGHIALATLEGIAYQVYDIVKAMEEDSGQVCTELRVDGGATANNLLMQIQANIFGFEVIRAKIQETTALGAAYLAGLGVGFYESLESLKSLWSSDKIFIPQHSAETDRIKKLDQWRKAVKRSRNWSD